MFWYLFSQELTGLNSGFTSIFMIISRRGLADVLGQNHLGALNKYLTSQVNPGSAKSEFLGLELALLSKQLL